MKYEIALLKIRSLISDKEMVIAQANHDLARFGAWQFDYSSQNVLIDHDIQDLLDAMEKTDETR